MNAPPPSLTSEMEAALAWWQLAGVDHDYHEDVTDWLAGTDAAVQPAPAPSQPDAPSQHSPGETIKVARTNLLGDNPPADLAAFRQFWLETPGLDAIGPRGRIAPRGERGAELMVLVTDPEERDREHLLSGPQGQLLARILSAMGLSEEQVYLASALPRHTPMADTDAMAAAGLDAVVVHHITLAAPKRILAMGSGILPLLGHTSTKAPSSLAQINQSLPDTPLLLTEGLDAMMTMPRLKARFWRNWMAWTAQS